MKEIIRELSEIKGLLRVLHQQRKEVLNLKEACEYIGISESYMYKLTSRNTIPHYCPEGKRLTFRRTELDAWCLRNPRAASDDIEQAAANYVINNKRRAS